MAQEILDLDSLVPDHSVVKLGGVEHKVLPPRTQDVLKLGKLGRKFQTLQENPDSSDDDTNNILAEMTAQVYVCIPSLEGKPLSMAQLTSLMTLIREMSVPENTKELDKAGITKAGPKATA